MRNPSSRAFAIGATRSRPWNTMVDSETHPPYEPPLGLCPREFCIGCGRPLPVNRLRHGFFELHHECLWVMVNMELVRMATA